MHNVNELLNEVKLIVSNVISSFENYNNPNFKDYLHSSENSKEIKSFADTFFEKEILTQLTKFGLPILTEESGYLKNNSNSEFFFIVDPLDGTFNFVKGLGPCAISIALWKDRKPVFGVIYDLVKNQLIYGGPEFGSYCDNNKIIVSDTKNKSEASICTGFPASFELNESNLNHFINTVKPFAKVRMLGSAAISLVNVASGISDVYFERSIMLWDVAAGIAIVEGAGGKYLLKGSSVRWSYEVNASNANLLI